MIASQALIISGLHFFLFSFCCLLRQACVTLFTFKLIFFPLSCFFNSMFLFILLSCARQASFLFREQLLNDLLFDFLELLFSAGQVCSVCMYFQKLNFSGGMKMSEAQLLALLLNAIQLIAHSECLGDLSSLYILLTIDLAIYLASCCAQARLMRVSSSCCILLTKSCRSALCWEHACRILAWMVFLVSLGESFMLTYSFLILRVSWQCCMSVFRYYQIKQLKSKLNLFDYLTLFRNASFLIDLHSKKSHSQYRQIPKPTKYLSNWKVSYLKHNIIALQSANHYIFTHLCCGLHPLYLMLESVFQFPMKTYGEYKIVGQKLGSGAFGQIYAAFNKRNEKFAIKVEKNTSKNPQLFYQSKILQMLDSDGKANQRGILKVYEYFTQGEESVMVMKPLGSSLQSLFKQCGKTFPLKTIVMIGLQVLERIECIHSQGFIHRDIKPDNFLIGKDKQSSTVFIIDFGLAKKFTLNGSHIAYKDNKNLTGTARYASINTHLGIQQGRRDDIEGMVYMLIYFFLGQLPWQNMDAKDKKEKYEKILQKKLITSPEVLCQNIPQQFIVMLKYVRNLYFDAKPDYDYIRRLLETVLQTNNEVNDKVFCWNQV